MPSQLALTSVEIQEIGESLYGGAWQAEMAKALGVPRQSIGYYLKAGGANRTQASAIIGLIARMAMNEQSAARARQADADHRQALLQALLRRFDSLS